MSRRVRGLVRALGLAAVAALLGSCVRLDPPTSYECTSNAECPAGERCSSGACLDPGTCVTAADCPTGQLCDKLARCVDPQCSANDATACNGFVCSGGLCGTSCTFPPDCQTGYDCNALLDRCEKQLQPNGGSCTSGADCFSDLYCCGQPGAMVCGFCMAAGSTCFDGSDCLSGFCCKDYVSPGVPAAGYTTSCHDTACSP